MTWQVQLSEDPRIVQVACSGEISADDLTMLAIETCHQLKQHGRTRVLIDASNADIELSTGNIGRFFDFYTEYRIPTSIRTAIIALQRKKRLGLSKPSALLNDNGYEAKVFTSESEALNWLRD